MGEILVARTTELVLNKSYPAARNNPYILLTLPQTMDMRNCLNEMAELNMVEFINETPNESAWVLTELGAHSVDTCCTLHSPKLVFQIRNHSVDMTSYEIVTHLTNNGWSWAILPPPKKRVDYVFLMGANYSIPANRWRICVRICSLLCMLKPCLQTGLLPFHMAKRLTRIRIC